MHSQVLARIHRRRRIERRLRVGTGFPDPSLIVSPGTAIPSPVTAAQGQSAVTLIWNVEFVDEVGDYPAGGTTLTTGGFQSTFLASGGWGNFDADFNILLNPSLGDPTLPGGGIPISGINHFAVFNDPPNNRMGVFLNGVQIDQGTGSYVLWSDGVTDWEFMTGVSSVGLISDLHIFLDFVPPGFVG